MRKLICTCKPHEILLFTAELSENLYYNKTAFCLEFIICLLQERGFENKKHIPAYFDLINSLIIKLITKFATLDSRLQALGLNLEESDIPNPVSKKTRTQWSELKDYIIQVFGIRFRELVDLCGKLNADEIFDYDEYIECTKKNANEINLKQEVTMTHL